MTDIDMNFDKILKSSFDLNLTVEQSLIKNTMFLDKEVEEQFKLETEINSKRNKIYTDVFIIFCYIAITIYIYIHSYEIIFIYICLAFLGVCLILIAVSYYKKSSMFNIAINYVMIFLLCIFLNFKIIYIALNLITIADDHDSKIIRTIVYEFVAKNTLCWMALDTRISFNAVLYLLNLTAVIVVQLKSNINHFYYVDCIVGLIITVFFHLLRKSSETKDRVIFSKKYRFEKYYTYTRNFIKRLDGYYVNVSNDFSINCDPRMMSQNQKLNDEVSHMRRNSDKTEINNFIDTNEIKYNTNNTQIEKITNNHLNVNVLGLFISCNEDGKDKKLNGEAQKLTENIKVLLLEPSTSDFRKMGIYKLESASSIKYFDVTFRKFSLSTKNSINDLMMQDITELIISRQNIIEESFIKQKIMAKLVHEFKTPINSIIGVIGSIEDSLISEIIEDNLTTMKHLNIVRNLSNYAIFLIGDIINFTNLRSLEDITICLEEINLREIANFGFDILTSLLRCNMAKGEAIQPVIEFDKNIDYLFIKADDVRLKQIVLNFVSNAVKFTKAGLIKLKCSISPEKEYVILSVIDTGVGISENEKINLFSDFKMVKNDTIDNAMGSGLGLSICKSLASSMNMKISTNSIFGQGSEFSLAIPIGLDSLSNQSFIHQIKMPNRVDSYNQNDMNQIIKFNESPRSYLSELGLKSDVMIQESKIFDEHPFIKPNLNTAATIKLEYDDYIYPNLNFNDIHNQIRNNTSNSNFSLTPRVNVTAAINLKKSGKILIVDDDHFVNVGTKHLIRKILEKAGSDMEIISCSDGTDIIKEIIQDQSNGNEIKCILTDEYMEYLNGSEAIKLIRNWEKLKKIKSVNIISLTSNEDSAFTNSIFKAGAQYVLKKPLSKFVLERILKELNII